jgi:putative inorganic carbon (HCO3(-)) transporter
MVRKPTLHPNKVQACFPNQPLSPDTLTLEALDFPLARMDFYLLLLVNVALFLRPQDLVPSLAAVPFYNILIVVNLVVAAPAIVQQLRSGGWRSPAILCLAGVLTALVVSLVARNDLPGAWHWGLEFAKVAAYFLLLTAVLTTTRRLVIYLATIVTLTLLLAGLAVAHFHGNINFPLITHAREVVYDPLTGEGTENLRLTAFGVFADPNDLSMIVVLSILICLGGLFYRRLKTTRYFLVGPLLFLGYALALTQSRGGLLALMAGLGVFLVNRYGMLRSLIAIGLLMPLLFVVFGGRQADITESIARGTGSQRTDLWYSGLQMLKWSPLVGMGHGQFVKEEGLVAHSSYIQALAEWGLIGGTLFIGLFYVVLYSIWRLKEVERSIASPVLRNLRPYVLGALAAYAASMLTLTRCDVVPTYLVAGLGVSYERLARRGTTLRPLEATPLLATQIVLVTAAFIGLTYIYIRFIYRLF